MHFIIGSVLTGACELGIIEMARTGDNLGKWHDEKTLKIMQHKIKDAFNTLWQFQEETKRLHGDCHSANMVWESVQEQEKGPLVLIDLERSLRMEDIKVKLFEDEYLPLRLVDVMHLLRGFFSAKVETFLRKNENKDCLISHMLIWTSWCEVIMPKYQELLPSAMKSQFENLFEEDMRARSRPSTSGASPLLQRYVVSLYLTVTNICL